MNQADVVGCCVYLLRGRFVGHSPQTELLWSRGCEATPVGAKSRLSFADVL